MIKNLGECMDFPISEVNYILHYMLEQVNHNDNKFSYWQAVSVENICL